MRIRTPSKPAASRVRLAPAARRAAAVLIEPVERRVLMSAAAAGQFDPAFGTGGTATAGDPAISAGYALAQAVQPDGKVVVETYSPATPTTTTVIHLTRFNANGTLDASFGTGGVASDGQLPAGVTKLGLIDYEQAESVLVQSDGKLLVTGTAVDDKSAAMPERFYAVRFNADGTVDPTFNSSAAFGFTFDKGGATQDDVVWSAALGPDGKAYLVGRDNNDLAVLRLNTDGSVDTTYGDHGGELRLTSAPTEADVKAVVDSSGRLVIAGTDVDGSTGTSRFAVTRLRSNGSQDPTFANYGVALSSATPENEYLNAAGVALDAAGDIVVDAFGSTDVDQQYTTAYAAARFTPAGAPDATFGGGTGVVVGAPVGDQQTTPSAVPTYDKVTGLAVQSDGRLLLTSWNYQNVDGSYGGLGFVTRLTAAGGLDASFGTGGVVDLGSSRADNLNAGDVVGVTFTPTAAGGTILAAFTSTQGTTAVRLLAAATGTPTPTPTATKLIGTLIGTTGSYTSDGNTIAKAVDGSTSTFFDSAAATGSWVGYDLGTAATVTSVSYAPRAGYESRMVGGVFQGSNSPQFTTGVVNLYTVAAPPKAGGLTTAAVTTAGAFRYVRYLSPSGGYGNVAEVNFFGSAGTVAPTATQLVGTTTGTAGSYLNDGNTAANATDGNLSTFFDGPTNSNDTVGLDLGTQQSIDQVRFAPRSTYASRMVGGVFQASTSADFSTGVTTLYTVTAAPADGTLTTVTLSAPVVARYVRYVAPAGSFGNVAEVQFFE